MRKSILAAAVLWAVAFTACEIPGTLPEDNEENRRTVAEEYLKVQPISDLLATMTRDIQQTMPESQRNLFLEVMQKELRVGVIEEATLQALTKNFTVAELTALRNFYQSPAGKSAARKLPQVMADVTPVIRQEIVRAAKAVKERSGS